MDSRVKSKETVGNSWTVFKSYFGSQISSQSLNDYSQNPQQKVSFFSYIFVFDCFESVSWIANGE